MRRATGPGPRLAAAALLADALRGLVGGRLADRAAVRPRAEELVERPVDRVELLDVLPALREVPDDVVDAADARVRPGEVAIPAG